VHNDVMRPASAVSLFQASQAVPTTSLSSLPTFTQAYTGPELLVRVDEDHASFLQSAAPCHDGEQLGVAGIFVAVEIRDWKETLAQISASIWFAPSYSTPPSSTSPRT
jgi:hypothetical protein